MCTTKQARVDMSKMIPYNGKRQYLSEHMEEAIRPLGVITTKEDVRIVFTEKSVEVDVHTRGQWNQP